MNFFSRLFASGVPQLDPLQAQERLQRQPKPLLLDVRQPVEYREGHIQGARLLPLDQLSQKAAQLPHDREIICVCHSGNRSSQAARRLQAAGFQVANLKGGMLGWQRAGLPTQKGQGR